MRYLTVHDIVWINTATTGTVNKYDYVTLEAAMAGQYRYGYSEDVPVQAASMLERLLQNAPFQAGSRRTALIALLTFLNANGYATSCTDTDLARAILSVDRGDRRADDAVAAVAAPAAVSLSATITLRKLITHECNSHSEALKMLSEGD